MLPIVITIGSENNPIKIQLINEAAPATSADIAGRTNIPEPSTAPIVNAVPCVQLILFLNPVFSLIMPHSNKITVSCFFNDIIVSLKDIKVKSIISRLSIVISGQ